MIKARKEKPLNNKGCMMFYFEDDLGHCLMREFLSEDKRDIHCKTYPVAPERCLNNSVT